MYSVKNGSEVWHTPDPSQSTLICAVNGTTLAQSIADALNRPTYLYQEWNAGNDASGNPRRVTLVYQGADVVAELDQGYSGDRIPRGGRRLPSVTCSVTEYRRAVRDGERRALAREYLALGGPTGISEIGIGNEGPLRACLAHMGLGRPGLAECGALRSMIWTVEDQNQRGIGPYASV